ncbi:MAG: hypothetical protein ACOVQR_09425 [Flavobacterium sp.]|jgi:hypothetical protein|uniref:hypothetical protein n=1 Tax=Flavobacterium sp. TaxID=239 RepID=UPI003BA44DDD
MTIIIKKKTDKKEIDSLLVKFRKTKAKKSLRSVFGIFKIEEDAVALQKKLRNEWD